jgi:WD40 repeat protein/serine/threonine protein kinase
MSPPGPVVDTDRNLLFGILALQAAVIDKDQFAEVCAAWTTRKATPLADLLVERGWLTAEDRQDVERLVQRHLARHKGDARQSLAAVAAAVEPPATLADSADPDLKAGLQTLTRAPDTEPGRSTYFAPHPPFPAAARYQVLRPHARGGLGEVSVALDLELHREVALKQARPEHANDPAVRSRFLREGELAGRLEHPSLVPVYGLGIGADGRPFYAMRFIQGSTLRDAIKAFHQAHGLGSDTGLKSLVLRQLLSRFLALCNAVAYLHSRGVLHRDLKPANVLLGRFGETLLVDLGLAKVIGRAISEPAEDAEGTLRPSSGDSLTTQAGSTVGTPAYMSPEQASGGTGQLGPASDVYSLGATLYSLLTGKVPFEGSDVCTVLERVQKGDWTPPRRVNPEVPAALDAICCQAIALRPVDRYPTALALAADVEHWLADEPVTAYSEPWRDRARRWLSRHQTVMTAAAATVAVAVIGMVIGLLLLNAAAARERQARAVAEQKEREAGEQRDLARVHAYVAQMNLSQRAWEEANMGYVRSLLAEAAPAEGDEDLRGFEWHYLNRLAHQELLTFEGHAGFVTSVAYSPDGYRLATGSEDKTIRIWDATTGAVMHLLQGHAEAVRSLKYSPDGQCVASGSDDHFVKVWSATTGRELVTLGSHAKAVRGLTYSPDGQRIASGSDDHSVKVWDTATGRELRTFKEHAGPVTCLAYSPDGRCIASGSRDKTVKVWEAATGRVVFSFNGHVDTIRGLAFSPDGRHLASGSQDSTVKVRDAATGRLLLTFKGHAGPVTSVAYSPDGRLLASGSDDNTVRIWSAATGKEYLTLQGHELPVLSVAYSPDGRRVASASEDRTVKVWETAMRQDVRTFRGHAGEVCGLAYSPDGKHLASGSKDNKLKIWDVASGKEVLTLRGHKKGIGCVAYSPDGQRLASGSQDGTVKVWDTATGKELLTLQGHEEEVLCVAYSPDGQRLASGSEDNSIMLRDASTGRELLTLEGHTGSVCCLAYSPDGHRLASGSQDNTIKVWDPATGKEVLTLRGYREGIRSIAYRPDGLRLASGCDDDTIKVWDAAIGKELFTLKGHLGEVRGLVYSPDGRRLVSGSDDDTIKIWEASTGRELLTLQGHSGAVSCLAYSPDGWSLASGGQDKMVRIWEALSPSRSLRGGVLSPR